MRFLGVTLPGQGYRIIETTTGERALAEATTRAPDLILLDLGLPDMDGLEVTRRIRARTVTPIIVISARGKEPSKIEALDAGADDFLTKPFAVGELFARMRAALRRAARRAEADESVLECGDIRIDLAARRVSRAGEEIHLTRIEYLLLVMLAKHAGKVLTHRQLLLEVRGSGAVEHSHYLRVYMGQLRRKLERDRARPNYILTEAGVGYWLRAN